MCIIVIPNIVPPKFVIMALFSLNFLPSAVKKFLLRSLLIFLIWKLLYHLILFPVRIPDKQLTNVTTYLTQQLLFINYPKATVTIESKDVPLPRNIIYLNNKKVVGIADGCNGLELYVLYVGFLIAFSGSFKKVMQYAILGTLIIFVLNTFRSYAITLLNIYGSSLTEVAHHYFFKLLIYGIMFLLWMRFTKTTEKNEA